MPDDCCLVLMIILAVAAAFVLDYFFPAKDD